jgi:hypothetical protein
VGIRIEAQSIAEIAVSIMAQYIQKRAELVAKGAGVATGKIELVR